MKRHNYEITVDWTGNDGVGTRNYSAYRRDLVIASQGKPLIEASSAKAFRGSANRYNPEELLLASLSSCHMLWYLHLCSSNGIAVLAYRDVPSATLEETEDGLGAFSEVRLRPTATISSAAPRELALELHHAAHRYCFIARALNFNVEIIPDVSSISDL